MAVACGCSLWLLSVAVTAKKKFHGTKMEICYCVRGSMGVQQHVGNGSFSPAVNMRFHVVEAGVCVSDILFLSERKLSE